MEGWKGILRALRAQNPFSLAFLPSTLPVDSSLGLQGGRGARVPLDARWVASA
jgi:hypothetical protein